ncbi:MAG: serine O-acetyltransferase [Pseudomonadota bacterium]
MIAKFLKEGWPVQAWRAVCADIRTVRDHDPAAANVWVIFLTYPGLHALWWHRLNHWLWGKNWRALASVLAFLVRVITAIEIHPAAKIGKRLFIDHGAGIVIGSTAEIGDDVTMYQGVTLGGTSLEPVKRHPTIGDHVIIGANATILGPVHIETCAKVGAGAVVLQNVPHGCTAVGVPARLVRCPGKPKDFVPYGINVVSSEDPFLKMREVVGHLTMRVATLEERAGASPQARKKTAPSAGKTTRTDKKPRPQKPRQKRKREPRLEKPAVEKLPQL